MSHHVVITGTGRSGTTFLMELLTKLRLDTGFDPSNINKHLIARAGLEINLLDAVSPPFIVKDPSFTLYFRDVLARKDIVIDHVFIAVRDLEAAAESRRIVNDASNLEKYNDGGIPGGLTGTTDGSQQENVLKNRIFNLVLQLSETDCDVTCLQYPLMTEDKIYLYEKLAPVLKGLSQEYFDKIFDATVDKLLVHKLSKNDVVRKYHRFKKPELNAGLKQSKKVTTQLFFHYGKGFSEKNSLTQTTPIGTSTLEFLIPTDKRINRLRFDPANEYCSLILGEVYVTTHNGERRRLTPTETTGYEHEGVYYFTDNDPQIYFNIGEAIINISIQIQYLDIGNIVRVRALPIIEKHLRLQIYKLKQQLNT
mgnify:CR=1 FL=1